MSLWSILSGRFTIGGKDEPQPVPPASPITSVEVSPTGAVLIPQDKEKAGYVLRLNLYSNSNIQWAC